MANLFSLSWKPFVVCYCFREPMKTFFFDACQMIVKSRVLHLFPVPQTGSHIINILLASFFRSGLQITDPRFFPSIYGSCASLLGHKSMEKNSVRNLQYGPKTRLIRGIYPLIHNRVEGVLPDPWPQGLNVSQILLMLNISGALSRAKGAQLSTMGDKIW